MPKLQAYKLDNGDTDLWFYCPGCGHQHPYRVDVPQENGAMWTWNGDMEKPTFTPSLLCNKDIPDLRCHLFLTDGQLRYCGDCHHELAGKIIDLPDLPNEQDID